MPDFYQQPVPATQPQGPDFQRMAQMLMQRGQGGAQGQPAGGALGGASQIAGALPMMARQFAQADANQAATAMNGGIPAVGQAAGGFQRMGNWLAGLGGA